MKRFYKTATVEDADGGYAIALDGRRVRTPLRAPQVVSSPALAEAMAAEWAAQGEAIDPLSMPMTGFANALIDHISPNPAPFVDQVAHYASTDCLCYRAEGPQELIARQALAWDPILDWARARYDVAFTLIHGVLPVDQPAATLTRLHQAVAALPLPALTAATKMTSLTSSLILPLALIERAFDAETIWAASVLDEAWQEERWGADHWAEKHRSDRERDFMDAVRFVGLLAIPNLRNDQIIP